MTSYGIIGQERIKLFNTFSLEGVRVHGVNITYYSITTDR